LNFVLFLEYFQKLEIYFFVFSLLGSIYESECTKCEQICSFSAPESELPESENSENGTDSSVVCSCYSGYEMKSGICTDIDECGAGNGGCFGACFNKPGSFACACPPGYSLAPDGRNCIDKNECLLRNGHGPCQDTCQNVPGSYLCGCGKIGGTRLGQDKVN
jgi:hypothetical protein